MHYEYTTLIPFLPLAGFLVLGLFGRKYIGKASGVIASGLLLVSTALSLVTAWQYFFVDGKVDGIYRAITPVDLVWLRFTESLSINAGITLDPISVMMLVVVTFVSLMVHVYSIGYMKGEERFSTFFAFLQLFTFSMLGLVMASNIFQIYIFWELVGVSSYLLIGFYYDRPSAVAASKKAFIVTRFADLGFLIGILILAFYSETLDFNTLIQRLTTPTTQQLNIISASFMGLSALTWGLVLVFIGGAGKSAMFPLHIWLPDAMEGPTPVSALIHAATMVVAGVFLVARLFPVFAISNPAALHLVAYVGILSALFAAVIACTQTDLKRVLAYSTMSQIGYMMFALGVASYGGENGLGFTASMFHLFTHAFFKSLLFLCAGVVIHWVHSNDIKDMGGLRKRMPVTHVTFLVACLAISGVPPFAGFFSKEEILHAAHQASLPIYWIGLLTSGITAFYMFRLYFSVFWNKSDHHETSGHAASHADGTWPMKMVLILLGGCTLLAGWLPFSEFVTADGIPFQTSLDISFSILPVAVALSGIGIAYLLYQQQNSRSEKVALALGGLYSAAYHKFYIDEVYQFITKKIIFNWVGKPAAWFDRHIIDGTMNGIALSTAFIAETIKGWQSGKLQAYTMYFFIGIFGMAILFIYFWK